MSREDRQWEAIKLSVSVSATMAGISIAIVSIIFIIFYQLLPSDPDMANKWREVLQWGLYSFILFALNVALGLMYIMGAEEGTKLSKKYKMIIWIPFVLGWAMLFMVVYLIMTSS